MCVGVSGCKCVWRGSFKTAPVSIFERDVLEQGVPSLSVLVDSCRSSLKPRGVRLVAMVRCSVSQSKKKQLPTKRVAECEKKRRPLRERPCENAAFSRLCEFIHQELGTL